MAEVTKLERNLTKLAQDATEMGKILNAAERLLALDPTHAMALKCKAVCCMHNEKFGTALATLGLLDSKCTAASPELLFQHCYCLYRMRRYTEAKAVLESGSKATLDGHIPSLHLLAQLHYNLGELESAARVYEFLLHKKAYRDDQERSELLVNYTAALTASHGRKAADVVRDSNLCNSDLVYNVATAFIGAQEYDAAFTALQQAESLCAKEQHLKSSIETLNKALALSPKEQDLLLGGDVGTTNQTPERRFFNSVVNIWVQMAFVHHVQRREKEAARILEMIIRCQPSSVVTAAIAAINWTAIQRHTDFVDSSRKLRSAQHERVASRLTSKQLLAVRYNTALLHLNTNSLNSCHKLVERLVRDYPESELAASLKLALAARENKKKKFSVETLVQEFLGDSVAHFSNKDAMDGMKKRSMSLIAAQIFLEHGDLSRVLDILKTPAVADVAGSPSGVVTRVAWAAQLDDVSGALSLLYDALQSSVACQANAKPLLVRALHHLTAAQQLRLQQGTLHSSIYKELVNFLQRVQNDGSLGLQRDPELTTLLVKHLARYDLKAAREKMAEVEKTSYFAASLANPPCKVSIIDIANKLPSREALEELGYCRATAVSEVDQQQRASSSANNKNRSRPLRRPAKNMNGRPDPERWIPMSMRSYIKDLPERRKKELKRLRALEQEQIKRRAAEKKKAAGTVAASDGPSFAAATPT